MNSMEPALLAAARRISTALCVARVPHVFIGSIALAAWARPRTTADIDILVLGRSDHPRPLIDLLSRRGFRLLGRVERDVMLAGFRLVPMGAGASPFSVDVLLSENPVVADIMERACRKKLGRLAIRVPCAEDFIVLKLQSGRLQDLADAEAVLRAAAGNLDRALLERLGAMFGVNDRLRKIRRRRET